MTENFPNERTDLLAQVPRPFRLAHCPELDGVRGVAIAMVMGVHLSGWSKTGVWRAGFLGVDLFFVLSGFLITSLLLNEWERTQSVGMRRFYARRALRLLPVFYFFIALSCLMAFVFSGGKEFMKAVFGPWGWKTVALTALYLPNWVHTRVPMGPLGITWSLGIEEQFYLAWPPRAARLAPAQRATT